MKLSKPLISIIIVNWNSGNLLREAVRSIEDNSFENYEVIIVDNASIDDSLQGLFESSSLKLIKNKINNGFGKGCNQGLEVSSGDFILFFNPDARLFVETLNKSLKFMYENETIGVLGVKLVDENGETTHSCSRFPSFYNYLFDALGLSKAFPKLFKPSTMMNDWDHENSQEVDQVMGAFMFCRKNIFEEIGNFDERYFVYYEDMDLSYRAKGKGVKIFFNSTIKAFHQGRGTTEQIKDVRLFYSLSSRLKFVKKHYNFLSFLLVFLITYLIEFFTRIIFGYFSNGPTAVRETIKAYKLLLKR